MHPRLFLALLLTGTLLARPTAHAMPAPWPEDELIKRSVAIAIVDIHEVEFTKTTGSIFGLENQEYQTFLILYTSSVAETIHGQIPKDPLIIQYDGAGDRNPLKPGRYLLFLSAEGHLFNLLEAFPITGGKVLWYKKERPGPLFGEIPLPDAIAEIRQLLKKHKPADSSSP